MMILFAQYFLAYFLFQLNHGESIKDYADRLANSYTVAQAEEFLEDMAVFLKKPLIEGDFQARARVHCERASSIWNHGRHFQDIGRRSRWGLLNDAEAEYMRQVLSLMRGEIEKARIFYKKITLDANNFDEYKNSIEINFKEDLEYKISLLSGWYALDLHALGDPLDRDKWVPKLLDLCKRASPKTADILLSDLSWLDVFIEDSSLGIPSLQYSRPQVILSSLRASSRDKELEDEFWLIYLTNFIQENRWLDAFLLAEFYCRENFSKEDALGLFAALWKISLEKNIEFSFKVKEQMVRLSRGKALPVFNTSSSLAGLEFLVRSDDFDINAAFKILMEIKKTYDKSEVHLDTWAKFLEIDILKNVGEYLKALDVAVLGAESFLDPYRPAFVAKAIELLKFVEFKEEHQSDVLFFLNKLKEISIKGIKGDQLKLAIGSRIARAGHAAEAIKILERLAIDSPLFLESAAQQMQIYDRQIDGFLNSNENIDRAQIFLGTSILKKKIKNWRLCLKKEIPGPRSISKERFLALLVILEIQSERVFDQPQSAIKILESALENKVVSPTGRIKKMYAELLDRTGRRDEARKIFEIIGNPSLFQEIARRELEDYIYSPSSSSAWDNKLMKVRALEYGSLLKSPSLENYFDWILVGKALDRSEAVSDSLVAWKELKNHYPDEGEVLIGFINSVFKAFESGLISIDLNEDVKLIGEAMLSVRRLLESIKMDPEARSQYWWCQSRLVQFGYLAGRHEGLVGRIYHLKSIDPNLGGRETFDQIDAIRAILEDES